MKLLLPMLFDQSMCRSSAEVRLYAVSESYDSVFTEPFWTRQKLYCRIELTLFLFFFFGHFRKWGKYSLCSCMQSRVLILYEYDWEERPLCGPFRHLPENGQWDLAPICDGGAAGKSPKGSSGSPWAAGNDVASLYQEWLTWGTGKDVFQPITKSVCFHQDWGEGLQEGVRSCVLSVPQGRLTPSSLGDFNVGFILWNMLSEGFLTSVLMTFEAG